MRARDYQLIGGKKVYTAHREMMDFCDKCFRGIYKGQWYLKLKKRKVRHYSCDKSEN